MTAAASMQRPLSAEALIAAPRKLRLFGASGSAAPHSLLHPSSRDVSPSFPARLRSRAVVSATTPAVTNPPATPRRSPASTLTTAAITTCSNPFFFFFFNSILKARGGSVFFFFSPHLAAMGTAGSGARGPQLPPSTAKSHLIRRCGDWMCRSTWLSLSFLPLKNCHFSCSKQTRCIVPVTRPCLQSPGCPSSRGKRGFGPRDRAENRGWWADVERGRSRPQLFHLQPLPVSFHLPLDAGPGSGGDK